MTVNLNPNEVVLKAGDTIYNSIEGKLIVTNQRLFFTKNDMNINILFDAILEVIFYDNGFFKPKGLNVVTKDGKNYKFPLKKRDEFGRLINKMY
jgi:hypothetical protein